MEYRLTQLCSSPPAQQMRNSEVQCHTSIMINSFIDITLGDFSSISCLHFKFPTLTSFLGCYNRCHVTWDMNPRLNYSTQEILPHLSKLLSNYINVIMVIKLKNCRFFVPLSKFINSIIAGEQCSMSARSQRMSRSGKAAI